MSAYPDLPSYNIHSTAPSSLSTETVQSETQETEPLSRQQAFKQRCVRILNKLTASVQNVRHRFQKLDESPPAPPSENPETSDLPKLSKMIEARERPHVLLQHGFGTEAMATHGIELQDLRRVGYTAKDLCDLFGSWETLRQAGFTKHNMDSELWSLDLIASLFQSSSNYGDFVGTSVRQIAQEMNFTLDDYLRTLPNVIALASVFNAETLLQHNIEFRHIFKMHLTPECFQIEFGGTREQFLELQQRVTPAQFKALSHACNWNLYNLDRVFSISAKETPIKIVVR